MGKSLCVRHLFRVSLGSDLFNLTVMASKRIAKSAVDWVEFSARVPKWQVDAFRAFKNKSDTFVGSVHKYPEALPAIDWSMYKSKIAMPGLVESFEKAYNSVNVPFPKDPDNIKASVDAQEADAAVQTQEAINSAKTTLEHIDSVPPPEEMTQEMYFDYFPEQARNPWDRPTFFPHTADHQPGNDPDGFKPGATALLPKRS